MISSLGKASKWIWGFRFMLFYQPLWDWKCHSPPTQHLVSCLQRYLWTLYRCTVTKANAVWAALRGTFPAAPSSAGHLFLDYSPIPVLLCLWLMLSDSSFSSTFSSHLPRHTPVCVSSLCTDTYRNLGVECRVRKQSNALSHCFNFSHNILYDSNYK